MAIARSATLASGVRVAGAFVCLAFPLISCDEGEIAPRDPAAGQGSPDGGESSPAPRPLDPGFTLPPPSAAPVGGAPGVTGEGPHCGITVNKLDRQPPDILLVLDLSGSMVENNAQSAACIDRFCGAGCSTMCGDACMTAVAPCGRDDGACTSTMCGASCDRPCGTRWDEVTSALDPVLKTSQGGANWGLKTYPTTPANDDCVVSDGPTVAIGAQSAMAIVDAYARTKPVHGKGFTPTREAIGKALAYLKSLPTSNPKYMLLATDGDPNCAVAGKGTKDGPGAVQAVAQAAAAGVPVFVVGVGTSSSAANTTLNMMAEAGGRPRADPRHKYFVADSKEDLIGALNAITAEVISCTFTLARRPPVPDNVAVEADGKRIMRDPARTNGWDYGPDMQTVQLFGEACTNAKNGTFREVQILFGCPDNPIE